MTERPIIFSVPMVRALLDGRKTQTRRIVKIRAIMGNMVSVGQHEKLIELDEGEFSRGVCHYESTNALSGPYRLPYAVGDLLWVREAWRTTHKMDDLSAGQIEEDCRDAGYSATWAPLIYEADNRKSDWAHDDKPGRLRPSIHMPRWASRITLRVTEVRVQRLQDISEEDAEAEGVFRHVAEYSLNKVFRDERGPTAIKYFGELWTSIHGPGAWDENPWVAAISFERAA